jgi:Carboxypeptidase regulatory-like domain
VQRPNDPACDNRPVGGAVLVATGAGGVEVARVTTDASGQFRTGLQPGSYTLEPQPVQGLMGTAAPMPFTVTDGAETFLAVGYDTGIR